MNRSLRNRVLTLVARRQQQIAANSVAGILVLPDNGRGPHDAGPLPRVTRTGNLATVVYDPAVGAPSEADVLALVGAA